MILEEMLRDEYRAGEENGKIEGRAEGKVEAMLELLLELLEDMGSVPEELRKKILSVSDTETLRKWHKQAAQAKSIEQFIEEIR